MSLTTAHLFPMIENFYMKPVIVQLYVPPIIWKGDPKGHIGMNDAFFYVVSGECFVMIEEECFILRPGQLAFLPKGKMRTYSAMNPNLTMYEINFECSINGKNWYEVLDLKGHHYRVNVREPEVLSRLFEESARYEFNKSIAYDIVFCSNIAEILKYYILICMEMESKESPFLEVLAYMHRHLGRQIRVEELAEVACMQTTYFIRKFKAAFGASPITYLNKLRMYHAMTLLTTTEMSVEEIARKVGIYDNSYFSRMFKNRCSVTPSEYRGIFR